MASEYKDIMRHINRAKSLVPKNEVIRAMESIADGLEELAKASNLFGREKMEVEIMLADVLKTLSDKQEFTSIFPKGLAYQKGKEKALAQALRKALAAIEQAIEQAETNKLRKRVNSVDKYMLAGQKFLDANDHMEARKVFRRAQQEFAEVPGVNQDIANRLFLAGLAVESVEFFEAAIEQDSRDSRPYVGLIQVYEQLGELEKAETYLKDTIKNFGANERLYIRMARLYIQMRKFSECYDAAQAALGINPFSREGKKISEKVESKVFSSRNKPMAV